MPESRSAIQWWRSPFSDSTPQAAPNSLFLEILDWMLAPLLLLWPVSIAFTNHYAHQIADQPYDGALIESVMVLSQYVEGLETPKPKRLPRAVQTSLTSDGLDRRFFSVSGMPVSGHVEALLENELPAPEINLPVEAAGKQSVGVAPVSLYDINPSEIPAPAGRLSISVLDVRLRDDVVRGERVRVAYRNIRAPNGQQLLVQVAETRNEREALVSRIIRGVLLPQFAMIPVAVILSYLGLSRGLRPLRRLHHRISVRRPGDLSPLAAESAPEEVRPLLVSLNEMMQRLEVNLHAQQRFIADAAHQMRTPLTGLKMQAELALEEQDPRRTRRSLQLIADSANRAAHLTNQLLMLARTEASHSKVHRVEPTDLRAVARAVTIEWAERAMVKDIDLAFEGGDWSHWPLMTEGVPLLLREMIYNLVDNAVKYTPHGGKVTVRVRSSEFVVLEVEDSGVGIPEAERQQVFERFYRVLGSEESGSGLGLPIVQEIADLHRARVELFESDSGGCLFRVSFVRRGGVAAPLDMRPD